MELFNNAVITRIEKPLVVHSAKGRVLQMQDRTTFGLSLCISGQITYTMNGKKTVSRPGNAVLLPQGGVYSLYGDKEGLFPLINFECKNLACNEIIAIPLKNPLACIKDFEGIQNLFLYHADRLKIFSAFYEWLGKITADAAQHDPLAPVIAYVEQNIAEPALSNALLAKQLGVSEVYLRKLFIAHRKTTPKQYILELRLRKAKQLLVDTPFTVTAIAAECGFSSVYHFCRAFKEKTGMTPTAYANAHKIYQI